MNWPDDYFNEVLCGDCFELMSDIPDESIDMILSDLPYGVTSQNQWDVRLPLEPLWNAYKRLIKPNGVIALTATQPFASELIMSNLEMFRYDLVWEKNKATGFLNANRMPLRSHELVLIFYKNLPVYNPQKTRGHKPVNSFTKHTSDGSNYGKTKKLSGGGQTTRHPRSVVRVPVVNNDSVDRIHPTQKPVALFEYLIRTYTNPNALVLDNCMGSGTTMAACLNTNRNYIGIDADADYCAKAQKRISTMTRALI